MDNVSADEKFLFFITRGWTGAAVRDRVFLDSIFLHHPSAHVFFVATTLHKPSPDLLESFVQRGYSLHGVHVPAAQLPQTGWWLTEGNRKWLVEHCAKPDATFFYTHLSDYLRFFMLHRYGGLYTDSDSVFVQTLPHGELVGLDRDTGKNRRRTPWFLDPDNMVYAAPGVLRLQKGSGVASRALATAFDPKRYDPECFNCVGPKAMGESLNAAVAQRSLTLQLLEPATLYPLSFTEAHRLFAAKGFEGAEIYLAHLRRTAAAIHLFGGMTRDEPVQDGSVVHFIATHDTFTAMTPEAQCSVGGATTLLVRGESAALSNVNMVFLRDCPDVTASGAFVEVAVQHGSISVAGGPAQKHFRLSQVDSLAAVNRLLASVVYLAAPKPHAGAPRDQIDRDRAGFDNLRVTVTSADGSQLGARDIRVAIFNRLVTVLTHTNGRSNLVRALYDSVQQWFPGTAVLASDDSVQPTELAQRMPVGPSMNWVPVPVDAGLSLARNTLVKAATTPFVYLMDDDFTLGPHSHLDVLLEVLQTSGFDIASAVIPQDIANFVHFRGFVQVAGKDLQLRPGDYGRVEGCLHVDFTPNVFMARRTSLMRSPWDDELKLGEHEDFFLRAKAAGMRVLSCDHVEITHNQDKWWDRSATKDAQYADRRTRVFEFFKKVLRKHKLQRLDSFGVIHAQLDENGK